MGVTRHHQHPHVTLIHETLDPQTFRQKHRSKTHRQSLLHQLRTCTNHVNDVNPLDHHPCHLPSTRIHSFKYHRTWNYPSTQNHVKQPVHKRYLFYQIRHIILYTEYIQKKIFNNNN